MSARQAGATSLGMQSENFGYSSVRLRRIKKLQFGVVNPNELVRLQHRAFLRENEMTAMPFGKWSSWISTWLVVVVSALPSRWIVTIYDDGNDDCLSRMMVSFSFHCVSIPLACNCDVSHLVM